MFKTDGSLTSCTEISCSNGDTVDDDDDDDNDEEKDRSGRVGSLSLFVADTDGVVAFRIE